MHRAPVYEKGMKKMSIIRILCFVLLSLIATVTCASATTYQMRVPDVERLYTGFDSCSGQVNFSPMLENITHLSFLWSGYTNAGVDAWNDEFGYHFIPSLGGTLYASVLGGTTTTLSSTTASYFNQITPSVVLPGTGDHGVLSFSLWFTSNGEPHSMLGARAEAYVTEFYVVADDNPVVPEPSNLLALGTGILSLAGFIRRPK